MSLILIQSCPTSLRISISLLLFNNSSIQNYHAHLGSVLTHLGYLLTHPRSILTPPGSLLTHLGICTNTSRANIRINTDPRMCFGRLWMSQYRLLTFYIMFTRTAVVNYKTLFEEDKSNQQCQREWMYGVRIFEIFVYSLFNEILLTGCFVRQ